jgi:hypothetical protein
LKISEFSNPNRFWAATKPFGPRYGQLKVARTVEQWPVHFYRQTDCCEAYNRLLVGHLLSQLDLSAEYDQTDLRIQSVIRTEHMAV